MSTLPSLTVSASLTVPFSRYMFEKVTSETPADPSATDEESGTSRLGAYDSRTNLTADMVPKAAIYPEGGSAEDIARAVVAHMGKKHEGLRVKSAQLKGNGWDKSTGVEGVASWTTYLLDTEEGNIGMQVLCQRDGSLLVSETSILKIDEVNGYDVKKNETVPLASATSGRHAAQHGSVIAGASSRRPATTLHAKPKRDNMTGEAAHGG